MLSRFCVAAIAGLALLLSELSAEAQESFCEPLLKDGIYDRSQVMGSSYTLSKMRTIICQSKYSTFQEASASSTDIGISVPDYFDANFGGKTTEENYSTRREQYCNSANSTAISQGSSYFNIATASETVAKAYISCVQNLKKAYGYVEPSSDLKVFTVTFRKPEGVVEISSFKTSESDVKCSDGLLDATPQQPIKVNGSASFICTREDPSAPITLSATTLGDGAMFSGSTELPGTSATIKSILERLASLEGSLTPSGQVGYFTLSKCPMGWERIPKNWEGRYFVSTVNETDPRLVVGVALGVGENRATGDHTHKTQAAFTGGNCTSAGCAKWGQTSDIQRNPLVTGGPIIDGVEAKRTPGTNAPYVTLTACIKI